LRERTAPSDCIAVPEALPEPDQAVIKEIARLDQEQRERVIQHK
jgi:hypothetical protein